MSGAVDLKECHRRRRVRGGSSFCNCEVCAVCGLKKHTGIHGPALGEPPGSKPYGHEFVSQQPQT